MTLAEAAPLLDPPVTAEQLMRVIAQLPGLLPVGTRAHGKPGPPWLVYDLDVLMELHAALARWLTVAAAEATAVPRARPGP